MGRVYSREALDRKNELRKIARELNPEKYAAQKREQYAKHREKRLAYAKTRHVPKPTKPRKTAEEIKEYQKAYRAAHKEKLRLQNMEWRQANAAELLAHQNERRAGRRVATPSWACKDRISVVYKKARALGMHVDHIVPLRSKLVSGLHVWCNLQLLAPEENMRKSNRYWPDGPEEGL